MTAYRRKLYALPGEKSVHLKILRVLSNAIPIMNFATNLMNALMIAHKMVIALMGIVLAYMDTSVYCLFF